MNSNTQRKPSRRLRLRPLFEKVTRSFCHSSKRKSVSNNHPKLVISSPVSLSSSNLSVAESFIEEPLEITPEEEENEKLWAPQENAETLAILESRDIFEEKSTAWKSPRKPGVYTLVCRPLSNSTHRTSVTAADRTSVVGSLSSRSSIEPWPSSTNVLPNSKHVTPIASPPVYSPTGPFPNYSRLSRGLSTKRTIAQSYAQAKAARLPRHGTTIDEPERVRSRGSAAYTPTHAASDFAMVTRNISATRRVQASPTYFQRPSIIRFHRPGAAAQPPVIPPRTSSAAYTPVHAASDFSRILDPERPIEYVAASVRPLTPVGPDKDAMLDFDEEPSPKSHAILRHSPSPFLLDNSDSDSESVHSHSSKSNVQICDFQTFLATSRIASARAARNVTPFTTSRAMDEGAFNNYPGHHSRKSSKPSPPQPQSKSEILMRKLGTYVKPVPAKIVYSNSYSPWGSWSDGSSGTCDSTLIGSDHLSSRLSSISSSAKRSHSRSSFRDGRTSLWGWEDGKRSARPSHVPISPGMKRYQRRSEAREGLWLGSGARRRNGIYFGDVKAGERSPVTLVSAGMPTTVDRHEGALSS